MSVTHTFVSTAPPAADPKQVGSTEWNDEHTIDAWDDLRVEPVARAAGVNTPTYEKWYGTATGTSRGVYLYSFDDVVASSEKELHFTMQMPHSWDGTAIYLHVHWVGSADDTAAAPRWGLEYTFKDIGQTFVATTIVYSDGANYVAGGTDANVTAGRHYISKFAAITPTTNENDISAVLIGRLFRNSSDSADTYNASSNKCGLLYIDAHFHLDSVGSRQEYIK